MKNTIRLNINPFIISLLIFTAIGCGDKNAAMQNELQQLQNQLSQKIERLNAIERDFKKIDLVESGDFLHEVYFNFKKGVSEKEIKDFVIILNELKSIEAAKGTQIGFPKSTGDKRMRKDYDVVLHMSFNNMEDYKSYQNNETHLSVKKRLGPFLSAPPFVYDYEVL